MQSYGGGVKGNGLELALILMGVWLPRERGGTQCRAWVLGVYVKVNAPGYDEWSDGSGRGRLVRLPPGGELALEAALVAKK